jgi:gluconokinase
MTTPDGAMEIAPEEILARTIAVIDAAVARARGAGLEIAAVATATFWHSLMGIGRDGLPLTPVFGWGDTRAAPAAAVLRQRLDETELHRRTGCFLHPTYPAVKLLWLRGTRADTFRRVSAWIGFGEYLAFRLFGQQMTSYSMASGTGLLDVRRLCWDAEMLDAVGVDAGSMFPLADLDTPFRGLLPEYARRWPELDRVPWFPALGDGACANVGSGAVGAGRVGLTIGTSAALRTLIDAGDGMSWDVPAELWCYRLDAKRRVVGAALSNGGSVVSHLERTLQLPPRDEWAAALAASGPDAHGLTVLPLLIGERSPGWHPAARAAVIGATQSTTPIDQLRAFLEAVALRLERVHTALVRALGPTERIIASGGALHASAVWTQIITDVLGRRIILPVQRETTSRGAALMALESLGAVASLQEAAALTGTEFLPNSAYRARYDAAARRHRELEELLLPWLSQAHPRGT